MESMINSIIRRYKLALCTLGFGRNTRQVNKKSTITGVYRIKNADATIELAIRSVVDLLDEVIVVDNNSTDNTLNILNKLMENYGTKIKIYKYSENLCLAGNGYNLRVKDKPSGSLARYYNYAFSLGSSDYLLKCDANYIFTPAGLESIKKSIVDYPDIVTFPGVEIFGNHHSYEPFLFKRECLWEFVDSDLWETLSYSKNARVYRIVNPCFIHIKRLNYVKFISSKNTGVAGLYGHEYS